MHTYNKNQRRIMRGLMTVAAEREAGLMINKARKTLARARIGCDNVGTTLKIQKMFDEFQRHLSVDFDNVPSETRIFRIAALYNDGILNDDDLAEFDSEMWEDFNSIINLYGEEE